MKIKVLLLSILLLSIFPWGFCLDGLEIFGGWLHADLREKGNYQGIPLLISFDFNAKHIFDRVGVRIKGNLDLVVEPFVNLIISPDTNVEIGSNFLVKYTFSLTRKTKPYIKGGLGILYMSQHTREQATQYNFLPQICLGFHYFFEEKKALSFECRYRHLSNSSIKYPNKGIDAYLVLGGISLLF
jgi:hypothetical protein